MSASNKSDAKSTSSGTGLKVLRIGVVQNGKIIDERELKKRETVSIGNNPKATFMVASEALPSNKPHELFEVDGGRYYLRFSENMDGKIELSRQKVADLAMLKKEGKIVKRGGADAFELTDESRGKVMVGDVTILFQFKTASAEPARPVLPADARGSILQNIDAQFAGIFVLVAVLQISLVTYARSLPYIEPSSIEQVGERYQKLIMPDRMPEPPKDAIAQEEGTEKAAEKAPDEGAKSKAPSKGNQKKSAADEEASARARKEAITKQVAGSGLLKVLGANRGGDGAIADVFSEGGVGQQLGDAFSGIQGVDFAESGGQSGSRGGGSGEGVGIGDLATTGGGNVRAGVKTETEVSGNLKTEAPEVDGQLSETEINSVMRRQLKSLRDCYENALKRNRQLSGKLVIRFEILDDGKTSNIDFEDDTLGSGDVRECIARRAKYWRFPKPDGGSVFVAYPIVFTPAS
jgi:hypothetical protein